MLAKRQGAVPAGYHDDLERFTERELDIEDPPS
jgi:hypothetical protein